MVWFLRGLLGYNDRRGFFGYRGRGCWGFCRGLGHIGPTKTSELKTTSNGAGSCRNQPIALPSEQISLARPGGYDR